MPEESDLEWTRFLMYREQELPRSRQKVAEQAGCSVDAINAQAQRRSWTERVRAWDAEVQRRADRATLLDAENRQAEHLKAVRAAIVAGGNALVEKRKELSAAEGARVLADNIRLERLILGAATERAAYTVEAHAGDPDPTKLSDEEREEWGRLLDHPQVIRFLELDDKARGAA